MLLISLCAIILLSYVKIGGINVTKKNNKIFKTPFVC